MAIVARIRNVASDPYGVVDAHYAEGQRAAVVAILDYALTGIEHGDERATLIPSAAVAQVHRAARSGVTVEIVVRRYMAAHAELGDFVIQEAGRSGLLTKGTALRRVQQTQASLLDRLIAIVSDEHAREIERLHRSPEQHLAERVRRLLAGELVDASELGYELDGWHAGLIASGPGAGQTVRSLSASLGCKVLSVPQDERSVWGWLGGSRETVDCAIGRLVSARWPTGVSLALGEPAGGLMGWRVAHQQAQDALLVSLHRPQALTRYCDVALLAPWLRDEVRARAFINTYLSALDNHRCPGSVLRKTLQEYFAAGRNATKAGRNLNVSRRTMRNRMVLIEESLPSLLESNQAELELALRLDELL